MPVKGHWVRAQRMRNSRAWALPCLQTSDGCGKGGYKRASIYSEEPRKCESGKETQVVQTEKESRAKRRREGERKWRKRKAAGGEGEQAQEGGRKAAREAGGPREGRRRRRRAGRGGWSRD